MCERSHRGLEGCREDLVEFFGKEEVMGVNEASERLSELVLSWGERTIVVRNILTLIFSASDEGRVKDGSGRRIRKEFSVHLGMFGELGLRECGSAGRSALWDMIVDGVTMARCGRCGVVGDGVEVDHGISSDHVKLLWGDVLRRSSLEVLGFLVHLEVVCWVIS